MTDSEVKRHLRAARKASPEAFDRIIQDYWDRGEAALSAPKPGKNAGRPREMNDSVRALFLAQVRNRIAQGVSQRQALREVAERKSFWGVPSPSESGATSGRNYLYYGTFENFSTVKSHFQKLERRCDTDEEFAERVDFLQWAMSAMKNNG